MAIDVTTPEGQVRLIIADMDGNNLILSDEHIMGYLSIEGNNLKLAAARALDAIATGESLLSKKLRSMTTSTDGPAVAADLRKHAAQLRKEVADGIADEQGFYLGVVPFAPYGPGAPEGTERVYW